MQPREFESPTLRTVPQRAGTNEQTNYDIDNL